MKIYFAGVPAGLQRTREEGLEESGIKDRLVTFFYLKKCLITMKHYKRIEHIEYKG
ncbi:unnamed protein product, partial [marine sediment metagenome]